MTINANLWLIDPNYDLGSLFNLTSKEYGGYLDRYKEYFKDRATYTKHTGYSVVNIHAAMVNKTSARGLIFGLRSYEEIVSDLSKAQEDNNDVVILDIDSPGGSVDGIDTVVQAIQELKANKKIYAYVSGQCFSAAYWIASATDQIIAQKTAQIGSLGAMISIKKLDNEQFGIKEFNFISNQTPHKNPEAGSELFNQDLQEIVNDCCLMFMSDVAKGRDVPLEKVISEFGRGKVFFAEKAKNLAMIDAIGSLKSIITQGVKNMDGNSQNAATAQQVVVETPAIDVDTIRAEAVKIERDRIAAISGHANAKHNPDMVKVMIEQGMSADQANAMLDTVQPKAETPAKPEVTQFEKIVTAQESALEGLDPNASVSNNNTEVTVQDRLLKQAQTMGYING